MATTPITDCVQIDFKYQQDGQSLQNSMYYQLTTLPTAVILEDMATTAETTFSAAWKSLMSDQIKLMEIVATDLTGLAGARVVHAVNPPIAGTNVSPALPLNVTVAVKRSGSVRGRGTAGRVFWPGLTEADVANNLLSEPVGVGIVTALVTMDTDIVTTSPPGTLPCIPHKTGAHAGTSTPLTDWSLSDLNVDSQRDRLPKHKRHKKPRVGP